MNKYKFNIVVIKKYLKRGFALLSATFVVASFSGCNEKFNEKGFETDDANTVSSKIEDINKIQKRQVILDCISEGNAKNLSQNEIDALVNKRLYEKNLLNDEERKIYESSLNNEESYVLEETSVYTLK